MHVDETPSYTLPSEGIAQPIAQKESVTLFAIAARFCILAFINLKNS